MTELATKVGDASRFPLGNRHLHFFNHPDHARQVLVDNAANYRKGVGLAQARRVLGDGLLTSEGTTWARQRRTLTALLQQHQGAGFTTVVADQARATLSRWPDDSPIDVVSAMDTLTLGVLKQTMVGADLGQDDALISALSAVQEQAMFDMVTLGAVPHWLPLPRLRRYRRAQHHLEWVVGRLLAGQQGQTQRGPAVPAMSRDDLVTLLLTGHETTAGVLAWTLDLLSRHPDAADRVAVEAQALTSPGTGNLPGPVPNILPFTTAVVREAMRLHPPVWLLPRRSIAEDRIGKYRVPAGTDVLICPYTLHRHRSFWERPDEFMPDRFLERPRPVGHRYVYLPFGAGPRTCPGSYFGLTEAVVVTALVAGDRHLVPVPGGRTEETPMLTLKPGRVEVIAGRRRR